MKNEQTIHEMVQKHYGDAARRVSSQSGEAMPFVDPITRNLYRKDQAAMLPAAALSASLGCGNPTMLAELKSGQVVLDLGSGGGIDVLLSARRVGPTGKAYGLDMTDDMLELARRNQQESGLTNVEFLKGQIEAIPLPNASVDVIISNCVINLAADKQQVLHEAFRVLRPNGLFAVSDIVLTKPLPESLRKSAELWAGCVSGALLQTEYTQMLTQAGFSAIEIQPTRIFGQEEIHEMAGSSCCSVDLGDIDTSALDGALISAFVRARKA
ncbi:MAG: arsenite methyltransferase [Acidobacteriota bacterium]